MRDCIALPEIASMPASTSFPAGLSLAAHKREALLRPLACAPPPARAVLAMDQGNRRIALPTVALGERVKIGAPIAIDPETRCAAIHAPVAGTVSAIEVRPDATETGSGLCIVIENDGTDALDPHLAPLGDAGHASPATLIERLGQSGIVGLGGGAFPTSVKLATARAKGITHLVLNGAECEPWICCDDALMRARADRVVRGAQWLLLATQAGRCTIAVEDDKPEAIAALMTALAACADERIALLPIRSVYPAGAERQLLAAVTGVEVPSGGLPSDVGLLCHNVGTAAAVADFAATGIPCLRRIVTVTGSGVAQPGNLDALIGTPVADLVAHCGGYIGAPERLIAGGTLTGRALATDEIGLTKAINCLIAATAADLAPRAAEMPCIRCGDCASVCPAGLLPQQIHRRITHHDPEPLLRFGLGDCIECGCCDYVCPSHIPLTQRFHAAKALLQSRADDARRADDGRRRFERHERRRLAAAEAERRAFDEARRRARGLDDGGS
jgi:electron transport complex protein RnfC